MESTLSKASGDLAVPDIFSFMDYRKFLFAHQEYRRLMNPNFSYEVFARQASMTRASLYAVVRGARKLPVRKARSVAQACHLSHAQEEYFLAMILWTDCQDDKLKELYWERLCNLAPSKGAYVIRAREQAFIGNWFVLALLELMKSPDFKKDSEWIVERFGRKCSVHEVERAIRQLLEFGFIRDVAGRYVPVNKTIVGGKEALSKEAIVQFHAKNMPFGLRALKEVHAELLEVSSMSIGVDVTKVPELKAKIRAFRKEILEYSESMERVDEVYQLNVQFFPMTKKVGT